MALPQKLFQTSYDSGIFPRVGAPKKTNGEIYRRPDIYSYGLPERKVAQKMKILIVSGQRMLSDGCKKFLEPEFEVMGIFDSTHNLIAMMEKVRPHIVIWDLDMVASDELDTGYFLLKSYPHIKVLVMAGKSSADDAADAFRRGASGYLLKQSGVEEFLRAVRRVSRGSSYLSPLITRQTVQLIINKKPTMQKGTHITPRQKQVLELMVAGRSMREIADLINIRPGTVAFHKYRMMETLRVDSTAKLFGYALKNNMLSIPGSATELALASV